MNKYKIEIGFKSGNKIVHIFNLFKVDYINSDIKSITYILSNKNEDITFINVNNIEYIRQLEVIQDDAQGTGTN